MEGSWKNEEIYSEFSVGQAVMARSYGSKEVWMPGIIISRQGPVSYLVQTERGNWKRHTDQLRGRVVPGTSTNLPQKDDRGFEIDFEIPARENSNEQGWSEAYNQRGASQQPPRHQCKFQDTHFVVEVSHLDHPITHGIEQFYSPQLSGEECYICELLFLFLSLT